MREKRRRGKKSPPVPYVRTHARGREGEMEKERNFLLLSLTRASAHVQERRGDEGAGERGENGGASSAREDQRKERKKGNKKGMMRR